MISFQIVIGQISRHGRIASRRRLRSILSPNSKYKTEGGVLNLLQSSNRVVHAVNAVPFES